VFLLWPTVFLLFKLHVLLLPEDNFIAYLRFFRHKPNFSSYDWSVHLLYASTDKEEGYIVANDGTTVIKAGHTSYFENLQTFSCVIF
jgi:hypothetical protein